MLTNMKRCSKSSVIKQARIEITAGTTLHWITLCQKLESWVISRVGAEETIQEPSWTVGWSVEGDGLCGKQTATYIPRTQQFCSLRKRHKSLPGQAWGGSLQHYYQWEWCGEGVGSSLTALSGEETVNWRMHTRGAPSNCQKPWAQCARSHMDGP